MGFGQPDVGLEREHAAPTALMVVEAVAIRQASLVNGDREPRFCALPRPAD